MRKQLQINLFSYLIWLEILKTNLHPPALVGVLDTVVSERVVLKTARTNVIGPVIYRIAHPSPLRGFTRIENQVSAHARAHRK